MKIEAVIFDVDGTLWDTTGPVADAWNKAAEDLGAIPKIPITADVLKQEFGKPMNVIVEDLFPEEDEDIKKEIHDLCKVYEHDILMETEKTSRIRE